MQIILDKTQFKLKLQWILQSCKECKLTGINHWTHDEIGCIEGPAETNNHWIRPLNILYAKISSDRIFLKTISLFKEIKERSLKVYEGAGYFLSEKETNKISRIKKINAEH